MAQLQDGFEKHVQLSRAAKWKKWLNSPVKHLVGLTYTRLVNRIAGGRLHQNALLFSGDEVELHLPSGLDIYLTGIKVHDSEIRLTRYLLNRPPRDSSVAIDCGAHIGYFSLILSRYFQTVHAFEPTRAVYALLARNCSSRPNIQTVNAAIGRADGVVNFFELPALQSESNTTVRETLEGMDERSIVRYEVNSRSLKSYCDEFNIVPDFIKVDVEGGEKALLEGAARLLKECAPEIALEIRFDKYDQLYRPVLDFMHSSGYVVHKIEPDGSLSPCLDVYARLREAKLESDNFVFLKK